MSALKTPGPTISALAVSVHFDDDTLHVQLNDGRTIGVPLEWFPQLRDATPAQRANWRLIRRGVGIHWKDIDEDVSVESLLASCPKISQGAAR